MYYIASILLSFPMMLAITSYVWGKFHNDVDNFPASSKTHFFLVVIQTIVITLIHCYQSNFSLYIISLLYFIQCISVLFLLLKKGNVTCGCLGFQSKSKLSYKLVFYNLILGSIALISASSISFNGLLSSGLFLEIVLLVLSLFIVIGVPDALYAIRGYRKVAEKYYPKISSRNGVN